MLFASTKGMMLNFEEWGLRQTKFATWLNSSLKKWPNISANDLYSYLGYFVCKLQFPFNQTHLWSSKHQHFSVDRKNTVILQSNPIPRIWSSSEKMQKHFKVVWIKRQQFLNQSNSLSPPSAKNTPGEEASRTHPSEPRALPGQCRPFYCIDARQLC